LTIQTAIILIALPATKYLLYHFVLRKYKQYPELSLTDLGYEATAKLVEKKQTPESCLHLQSIITVNEIGLKEDTLNGTPLMMKGKSYHH